MGGRSCRLSKPGIIKPTRLSLQAFSKAEIEINPVLKSIFVPSRYRRLIILPQGSSEEINRNPAKVLSTYVSLGTGVFKNTVLSIYDKASVGFSG